jgi:enhancing lycopene biosynthesis protein 2
MKASVILSGCGVYDGCEIQEAVLAFLALQQHGFEYDCWAPNRVQFHVVNHLTGEEMPESRNVLVESARIARGQVNDLAEFLPVADLLVIPGGFGAAKNLSDWAVHGPSGCIQPEVGHAIRSMHAAGKPIVALCMAPVLLAHALGHYAPELSLGQSGEGSPYDIAGIHAGAELLGAKTSETPLGDIWADEINKLVCGPCYMMHASLLEVHGTIQKAVAKAKSWI